MKAVSVSGLWGRGGFIYQASVCALLHGVPLNDIKEFFASIS